MVKPFPQGGIMSSFTKNLSSDQNSFSFFVNLNGKSLADSMMVISKIVRVVEEAGGKISISACSGDFEHSNISYNEEDKKKLRDLLRNFFGNNEKAAKALSINPTYLSRILNGSVGFSLAVIKRMVKNLKKYNNPSPPQEIFDILSSMENTK